MLFSCTSQSSNIHEIPESFSSSHLTAGFSTTKGNTALLALHQGQGDISPPYKVLKLCSVCMSLPCPGVCGVRTEVFQLHWAPTSPPLLGVAASWTTGWIFGQVSGNSCCMKIAGAWSGQWLQIPKKINNHTESLIREQGYIHSYNKGSRTNLAWCEVQFQLSNYFNNQLSNNKVGFFSLGSTMCTHTCSRGM